MPAEKQEQHHTETGRVVDAHDRVRGWLAHCSCGWVGQTLPDPEAAEIDATDHVVAATRGD